MANGKAIPRPEPGILESVFAAIAPTLNNVATFFAPINLFRFSFALATALCLIYSIALPTRFYFATGRVLLSDSSIYFLVSAIGMFLTERALKEFDRRMDQPQ